MNIKKIGQVFLLRDIEMQVFEKLIYKHQKSATELSRELGISRTSIYDLLNTLTEKGLIKSENNGTKKMFALQDPLQIQALLKEKGKEVVQAQEAIEDISLIHNEIQASAPTLHLYKGRRDLQKMMNHMLLKEGVHVLSYWPIEHIEELLTEEFFKEFHKRRVEKNITVDMILPYSSKVIINRQIKKKYFTNIQVRFAPKDVHFSLGYTIYGTAVRFISSKKENFGFLIKSKELAETMAGQFKIIWSLST